MGELPHAWAKATASTAPVRFLEARDPRVVAAPKKKRWLALPFIVAALVAVAVARALILRALLPVVLVIVAVALLVRRGPRARREPEKPRRGLHIGGDDATFRSHDEATKLIGDGPFGVTLVATAKRDRIVAVLSSEQGSFHVGADLDAAGRDKLAPLLGKASTMVHEEGALEAIGPDGEPLLLEPDDFVELIDALERKSPSCLDRIVLTDTRGASITLDRSTLTLGERTLDLTAPLEWRPIVFQEPFGGSVAIYQGTWVRQNGTEVVLVSLLPSLAPPHALASDLAALDRAALRDLRLMQASPEEPPPPEQRVAIDRLFMLPFRSAIDRAPRRSHQPNAAQP